MTTLPFCEAQTSALNNNILRTTPTLRRALQQTTSELEAMKQNIAATEAGLQKLSDQVSALATRVDASQKAPPSPSASSIARQPSKKPTQTLRPAPN